MVNPSKEGPEREKGGVMARHRDRPLRVAIAEYLFGDDKRQLGEAFDLLRQEPLDVKKVLELCQRCESWAVVSRVISTTVFLIQRCMDWEAGIGSLIQEVRKTGYTITTQRGPFFAGLVLGVIQAAAGDPINGPMGDLLFGFLYKIAAGELDTDFCPPKEYRQVLDQEVKYFVGGASALGPNAKLLRQKRVIETLEGVHSAFGLALDCEFNRLVVISFIYALFSALRPDQQIRALREGRMY